MNLGLYWSVLTRRKLLMSFGVLLAAVLAAASLVRVDVATGHVMYRSQESWVSYARIFVTQPGFPYGELRTRGQTPAALASNALFYANLATSDPVLKLAFGAKGPQGEVQAAPVIASQLGNAALPIVSIAGIGKSKAEAKRIARQEITGLTKYVELQQAAAKTQPENRIVLQVVNEPRYAARQQGRSVTLPAVVFLTVLLGFFGIALVLENVRRTRPAATVVAVAPEA